MAGVSYATFWELHRLLGECYANDVAAIASVTRRSQPGLELAPQWSTSNEASSEDDEKFSSQVLPKRRMSRRASTKPLRTGLSFHGHSHQRTFHEEGGVFDSRSRPQSQEPERRHLSRRPQEMSEHDANEAPTDGSNTNPCETLLQLQGLAAPPDGDMAELNLKPHPCWEMKENRGRQSNTVRTIRSRKVKQPANSKTSGGSGFHLPSGEFAERWMWLHPSGGFRACWNSLVALLVLYDLLVIPLSVFDHPKSSLMHAMDIGMPTFWSMDFILTFFTGYYQQGELISDFKKIAYQYAMHWMLYDLGLIALDWIFVTMDYFMLSGSEGADWSRSLLMLRILRLARIMRAIKLRQGFDAFQDLLHSQANSLYVSFLTSLGQLLILNHWMACAWFGVRWLHPNDNWVVKSGMDQNYWTHQYLMCMLWSFCQLGVGESPLQPTNETEMVLNCVIAFRSLITSATLISTMSNLIAGLRSLREDEATQFRLLRRFLAQNSIPHEVSHKVTQFLQHQFAKSQKARSSDLRVPLLDLLSRPLFRELQFERHRTSLCKLPVLKALLEAPDIQTLEVMHSTSNSLCQLVAAAQDIIFLSGSHASSSYLKLSGTLTYYDDAGAIEVDNRCWVAEACLWTPWIHMGEFEAKEVSDLLCLDADCFCEALSKTGSTQQAASAYAMEFLAAMQKSGRWTDIFVDHDLNSVDGEAESPKMDLPLPGFCGGFCPRLVRKRPHAPRLQSILPDESDEPDLS